MTHLEAPVQACTARPPLPRPTVAAAPQVRSLLLARNQVLPGPCRIDHWRYVVRHLCRYCDSSVPGTIPPPTHSLGSIVYQVEHTFPKMSSVCLRYLA